MLVGPLSELAYVRQEVMLDFKPQWIYVAVAHQGMVGCLRRVRLPQREVVHSQSTAFQHPLL
jgi:hypothetical protein